jgi:hypothetical protein
VSNEKEEARKCIQCDARYRIIFDAQLDSPESCPFCGAESLLDDSEEGEYDEGENEE